MNVHNLWTSGVYGWCEMGVWDNTILKKQYNIKPLQFVIFYSFQQQKCHSFLKSY